MKPKITYHSAWKVWERSSLRKFVNTFMTISMQSILIDSSCLPCSFELLKIQSFSYSQISLEVSLLIRWMKYHFQIAFHYIQYLRIFFWQPILKEFPWRYGSSKKRFVTNYSSKMFLFGQSTNIISSSSSRVANLIAKSSSMGVFDGISPSSWTLKTSK